MNHTQKIKSVDLAKLDRFASQLVAHFSSQMAIGLVGTLGAGKTTLVQRIAFHLGLDPNIVTSPTFTLLQSYQPNLDGTLKHGSPPVLNHLDAYRLSDEDEFWELGVDELFEQPGWTLVEWADRVASAMPENTLWIRLEPGLGDFRQIELTCTNDEVGAAMKGFCFGE